MKKMKVISLSKSATHTMSKKNEDLIFLEKGHGVKGDAHFGTTVKHRSRVAKDPTQPNLRQVHLIHSELHEELLAKGFQVAFGQMGENITTKGIELLDMPRDTILRIGKSAAVQITGLRNPCSQLEGIQKGLMKALLDRDEKANLIRKAGVMGIVLESGTVKIEDEITIELPNEPFIPLDRV